MISVIERKSVFPFVPHGTAKWHGHFGGATCSFALNVLVTTKGLKSDEFYDFGLIMVIKSGLIKRILFCKATKYFKHILLRFNTYNWISKSHYLLLWQRQYFTEGLGERRGFCTWLNVLFHISVGWLPKCFLKAAHFLIFEMTRYFGSESTLKHIFYILQALHLS